jgi:hypothetical protein
MCWIEEFFKFPTDISQDCPRVTVQSGAFSEKGKKEKKDQS